jgi:hypothetical protein
MTISSPITQENGDAAIWPQTPVAGVGTTDVADGKEGSGGLQLVVDEAVAKGNWKSELKSGPLAVGNSETHFGKLTLSFNLSVSAPRPVKVRVESFNAEKQRTGGLEIDLYPAAADFYQRYAVDLSTMKPAGGGTFNPADPFVSFTFELNSATGWAAAKRHELRLDNVHYASPAYYISPTGNDAQDGRTEQTALASPQNALDAAQPGDIIVLMNGTYVQTEGQSPVARFVRPGTPAGWITLKNYPGHKPMLLAQGRQAVNITQPRKGTPEEAMKLSYLEVRGLHVRGDGDKAKEKYPADLGN